MDVHQLHLKAREKREKENLRERERGGEGYHHELSFRLSAFFPEAKILNRHSAHLFLGGEVVQNILDVLEFVDSHLPLLSSLWRRGRENRSSQSANCLTDTSHFLTTYIRTYMYIYWWQMRSKMVS